MALFVKLWTDILADPKLMRAARKGAKSLVLLPWLIVFAKQADDDGRLTVNGQSIEPDDIVNVVPGVNAKQVVDCLASLVSIGVLVKDEAALRFANWEERSGKPSDGAEAVNGRVRKHRTKKRAERADCNAPETRFSNATEQEQEKEQEKEQEIVVEELTQSPGSLTSLNIAVWSNGAVAEKWGDQVTLYNSSSAEGMLRDLVEQGVDAEIVRLSIYQQCRASKQARRPSGPGYFLAGILTAWGAELARRRGISSGERPPPTLTVLRPKRPPPQQFTYEPATTQEPTWKP